MTKVKSFVHLLVVLGLALPVGCKPMSKTVSTAKADTADSDTDAADEAEIEKAQELADEADSLTASLESDDEELAQAEAEDDQNDGAGTATDTGASGGDNVAQNQQQQGQQQDGGTALRLLDDNGEESDTDVESAIEGANSDDSETKTLLANGDGADGQSSLALVGRRRISRARCVQQRTIVQRRLADLRRARAALDAKIRRLTARRATRTPVRTPLTSSPSPTTAPTTAPSSRGFTVTLKSGVAFKTTSCSIWAGDPDVQSCR